MYCSNVLLGKRWHAVYVDESLQHGRVPESYKAQVKQQEILLSQEQKHQPATGLTLEGSTWGECRPQ